MCTSGWHTMFTEQTSLGRDYQLFAFDYLSSRRKLQDSKLRMGSAATDKYFLLTQNGSGMLTKLRSWILNLFY